MCFCYLHFWHPSISMDICHTFLYTFLMVVTRSICFSLKASLVGNQFLIILLGPVFWKPISANPGLNFNLGFYTSLFDSLFGIIFSTLYGASNHQTVDKKNSTEFSLKASRAEIRFHTNPGLSKPSFEQPSPDPIVWLLIFECIHVCVFIGEHT